jgi:hypothetical protein
MRLSNGRAVRDQCVDEKFVRRFDHNPAPKLAIRTLNDTFRIAEGGSARLAA